MHKTLLFLTLLYSLDSSCHAQFGQKDVIQILVKHGQEILSTSEQFFHEQRRLGHESLLHVLERHNIELELLLIELTNRTTDSLNLENDEKFLLETHQIDLKLFDLENLVEEEILKIKNLTAVNQTTTIVPSIKPVTENTSVIDTTLVLKAKELLQSAKTLSISYNGTNSFQLHNLIYNLDRNIYYFEHNTNEALKKKYLDYVALYAKQLKTFLDTNVHSNTTAMPITTVPNGISEAKALLTKAQQFLIMQTGPTALKLKNEVTQLEHYLQYYEATPSEELKHKYLQSIVLQADHLKFLIENLP